ncbi:MAG TPA: glutamine-hydrolyzing carbamoyl-phosphate synthase small subunit [Smithella sp.]|nr:glutamine-hydrolyzing carbamoyl-phosphate synthase small subunit [Smithella sp.]MDM7986372.1 glutamine-hydrolyzing carbamoyl-phosphate synthase small subunit [Smithella sp.]HNY49761.1 glutamine-hydrolyzing carbamoyl-phosphate synthase small subunit [Smithella sp.]HOG90900.1 glutamine-hydrolyzing carbamoyl-phosphate synthase small subunit [Smithella sp.]HOU51824.1 glutamine-hydrolyzing carbamoyl-phosphate synthase small subunit [Smithella sp.]
MPLLKQKKKALLILEDGSVFEGYVFAGSGETMGEVVFNTGMTGYQEVITDPSYKGQIVTMTYPLIGNYGINDEDMESAGIHLEGFIVKEYQPHPSNWRMTRSLKSFLEDHGKIGIEGIDTRALTRRLRISGAMKGIISTNSKNIKSLLAKVQEYPGLVGRDLVKEVSCKTPYLWKNGTVNHDEFPSRKTNNKLRVAVLDCGVKYNILRLLEKNGCEIMVLPATSTGAEILAVKPDGVLLSNGPGDPAALPYIVDAARAVIGKVPVFGICLGHQIIGQAIGGYTEKLKFGHHGINQPVKNVETGRVEITSQNHGFVVVPDSVKDKAQKTYHNLNDNTSEGMRMPEAFSVQYHPEAAPGPRDTEYLFEQFVAMMKRVK